MRRCARELGHIEELIDLCADLGAGGVMVFGSPKQRATTGGSVRRGNAVRNFADGLAEIAPHAAERGVTILVEALPTRPVRRGHHAGARRPRSCARSAARRAHDVRHAQRRGRSGTARDAGGTLLRSDPPRARERDGRQASRERAATIFGRCSKRWRATITPAGFRSKFSISATVRRESPPSRLTTLIRRLRGSHEQRMW